MKRKKPIKRRRIKTPRPTDDYPVVIFYSEEDEGYIADLPDLKYCSAFGRTPQEALRQILIAKQGWLAVARESGHPLPKHRYKVPRP